MNRRFALSAAGLAGVLAAGGSLVACGKQEKKDAAGSPSTPAVSAGNVRWRLSSSFPRNLDILYNTAEVFAQAVKAMSGGTFEVSVHAGGEITPPFGVVEAVGQGAVEMAHTAPYYFFGKNECFALGCAIPFGLNSRQTTAWMTEGNGQKLMREFYAKYNIVNFPGGNTGAQMGGWYRKEINSVQDIKGLKMRLAGLAGKILERMGGVPQNLPGSEVYSALEKGTIDAAEWIGPYDDQKLGFNKIAPFYYYPGWWEGGPQLEFFIHDKAYNALSAEHKAIVQAASAMAHGLMQARYDYKNPTALKELVAKGTKLRPFGNDIMKAAFDASMTAYAELNERNPDWKRIYADYSKYRADANMWFHFSEAKFDQFMQAQKL